MFSFPVVVHGFITSAINFIDSLMTGMLEDTAVGAVAAASRFFMILLYAVGGMSGTTGVYISQFYGASRKKEIRQSFYAGIIVTYGMLIPFFILLILRPDKIISFFSHDPDIIREGTVYVRIVKYSFIPLCLSLCISSGLQAIGLTRIPLVVSGVSVIVKVVSNLLLMYGNSVLPWSGVTGAAVATVITRVTELIMYLCAIALTKPEFVNGVKGFVDVPLSLAKRIVITAIPFSVNNIAWAAGNSVILKIYGNLGTDNYNAYVILTAIDDIFFNFNASYGNANSVLIAQQIGKDDRDKAREFAYKTYGLALIVGVVLCVVLYLMKYSIPLIYSSMSDEVVSIAARLTVLQSVTFILYEMSMQNYYVFMAGGDTRSIAIMDSCMVWFVQIPILYICAHYLNFSIETIFLGSQSAELIKLFLSTALMKKERWLNPLAAVSVIEST